MCGILAVISKDQEILNEDRFSRALARSKHRGPDGSKIEKIGQHSLFGFNWLTIQDTQAEAMQPFNHKGNTLIFNGEIYNFLELRKDLEVAGTEFCTESDTEVLAAGLTLYGIDFLEKINGIFGFCFWNAKTHEYLIVRDRFGIKPLFYYNDDSKLIVSSEVKSILEYVEPKLDILMLRTQLFLDPFVGHQKSRSFFENIKSLEPAMYLIVDEYGKIIRSERYYKSNFQTSNSDEENKIIEDFSQLLDTALEWETRSAEPVGIVLSGGIDSTTILAGAVPRILERQKIIPTFTYFFENRGEKTDLLYVRQLIDALSKQYGNIFEAHELNFDDPFTIDDFMNAVEARETPVLDIRNVTGMKMYQAVKKANLKVVLNGQGSDEIYYGYYPLDYWMSVFYRSGDFNTQNILEYFRKLNHIKFSGLNNEFLEAAEISSQDYIQNLFNEIGSLENQQKLFTSFIRQNVLLALLASEDKFGMYSSVEVRVPLINRLLVDYADKLDWKTHILSTTSGRHLFRKILENKLPKEIVYRTKEPGPKKKNYAQELIKIIRENKDNILNSDLVSSVYNKQFIENMIALDTATGPSGEPFYGGLNDVLVEIIGLYCFEKVYGVRL